MAEEAQAIRWDKSRLGLGVVLLAAGIFVLVDIALVSTVSAIVIGGAVVAAGALAIVQSLSKPTWRETVVRIVLAFLYIAFGVLLIVHPSFQAIFMKFALAAALVVSGGLRIGLALVKWSEYRWLLISGLVGLAGGVAIFIEKPMAGIAFIAGVLGADLLTHGFGWIMTGLQGRRG